MSDEQKVNIIYALFGLAVFCVIFYFLVSAAVRSGTSPLLEELRKQKQSAVSSGDDAP